ncbi:MAG: NTP transferase domain-containing protein [Rhodospirillales bacterium]
MSGGSPTPTPAPAPTPVPTPGTARATALVLAGRRGPDDPVAVAAGLSHKCLVPAGGVPMLARVIAALAASHSVARIAVSIETPGLVADLAPSLPPAAAAGLVVVESRATPSLSALAAAEALDRPFPLLITTADHPLLTPDVVDSFLAAAHATGADVAAGLVPAERVLAAHPDAKRTFLRFRDGRMSGCNLFCVRTATGLDVLRFWRRVERDRKRPWRIATALGPGTLLRYGLGRLTLAQALERLSKVAGADARAVVVPVADAAIDVDKADDLALVERILAHRERAAAGVVAADPSPPTEGCRAPPPSVLG